MSQTPEHPKIYHILHVDRLPSVVADGCLWSDAEMVARGSSGTGIGMSKIKQRRLRELLVFKRPPLFVGECVPFYFCPRSVMLYVISRRNHLELAYTGGQEHIVHLEADLQRTTQWAEQKGLRWAFTSSNAGARYSEFHTNLDELDRLDWSAINAGKWGGPGVPDSLMEKKQAELLIESRFPWNLVDRIGVISGSVGGIALNAMGTVTHRPHVEVHREWYY
jgi:hypothetical protein